MERIKKFRIFNAQYVLTGNPIISVNGQRYFNVLKQREIPLISKHFSIESVLNKRLKTEYNSIH